MRSTSSTTRWPAKSTLDAVGKEEILIAALRAGQPFFRVHVFPFRMSPANMRKHGDSEWRTFWENLKRGHDHFAAHDYRPPDVRVSGRKYVFR